MLHPNYTPNPNLERLHKVLNFELTTALLLPLALFYIVSLNIAVKLASIFTPYLFYVLFEENRYGWIIFYVIFVTLPPTILYFNVSDVWVGLPTYVGVVLFYVYCVLLKAATTSWMD